MNAWFAKKAAVVAVVVFGTFGAAGAAQACVWSGYVCVPMCHIEYTQVWVQTGPFAGQGYWTTVANNVCY